MSKAQLCAVVVALVVSLSWAARAGAQDSDAAVADEADAAIADPDADVQAPVQASESQPLAPPTAIAPAPSSPAKPAAPPPTEGEVLVRPLTTEVRGRELLEAQRRHGGSALTDTSAALLHGGPGTSRLELRLQPTLILLNGRRLISAPYPGPSGADYVDINQLPIALIDRVEITRGLATALYGDGAVGGVINFITRRDLDGVEVDVGGQGTDDLDQHEIDVSLTGGMGDQRRGVNATVNYFNRQPLAATDSDWIGAREERVESLLGSPGSYQQLAGFDYPFPDPYCDIAQRAGHSSGREVRLLGYGPPETLGLLPPDIRARLLMNQDFARGDNDGLIEEYETGTYCATNFTPAQDLILKDERLQAHGTFWYALGDRSEAFGELSYYSSRNENRTAPSFPIARLIPSSRLVPLDTDRFTLSFVPAGHADQPVQSRGFSAVEAEVGRRPVSQFIVGRVAGLHAGHGVNTRNVDVMRGVLGVKGELMSLDWELASMYSQTDAVSSVPDVLMDKLHEALNACQRPDDDRTVDEPTTIKERQEAGCFNPFYSSVTNNVVLDPLGVSNGTAANKNGFPSTDTDPRGSIGYGAQDGGYICDPNDPSSPPCPPEFDQDGDGVFELAGTPNTAEVMDRIMGQHITMVSRTLATLDGSLGGDLVQLGGSSTLSFGLDAQYRRETLEVDHDAAYNARLYAFLFGAPDVPVVARNVGAATGELGLTLWRGLVQVQAAARVEHVGDVGTAFSPLAGLALRPLAARSSPPAALEWLVLRGHIGRGERAPSLQQMHGGQVEFHQAEWTGRTSFVPHFIGGNDQLDFESYTTVSGGAQWDFAGIHVGGDFWKTFADDLISADNSQTLLYDCEQQRINANAPCHEAVLINGAPTLDHIESAYDNLAEVDSTGIDGSVSFALDTKRRGLGDIGTFTLGAEGTFILSYLIKSPRALREYYRIGGELPVPNADGTRDYSSVEAEYEAAGYRNADNFAPPIPKLRFAVPLRWQIGGHALGVAMRYIGGYNDDSEHTIEHYGLANLTNLAIAEGEAIPAWTVFDASYGFEFGDDPWRINLTVGAINLLDTPPPAVESPLGYEVGVHDPRGRVLYVRARGSF